MDVLEETFTQLRHLLQNMVEVVDECAIFQFIMYLNELCEIVYQGEQVFTIENSQVNRKQKVIPFRPLLIKSLKLSQNLVCPLLGHLLGPRTVGHLIRPRPVTETGTRSGHETRFAQTPEATNFQKSFM